MQLRGLALALSCVSFVACGDSGAGARAGEAAAPSIEVTGLAGVEAALAAQRGKAVLLNFWAIWCPPCVAELPELLAVRDAFRDEGGLVLGVSYDLMVAGSDPATIHERVRRFLEARNLSFPVLVFDEPDFSSINERFGLPGEIPVTLAFDRGGALVDRQEGPADRARFEAMMRKALGE